MWRNYLTVAYRALTRNRTYAFINIFGLALGLAACLMLLVYVRFEATYDHWLPEAERVFQVQTFGTDPETGESLDMQATTRPVADALAAEFPQQLEAVARLEPDEHIVLIEGRPVSVEGAAMADATFFDIMQIPFLRGNRATALDGTDSVTLSRSEAMRLFGSIDVVGRTLTNLRDGEPRDLRVTGVFEDLPGNTHMDFSLVRRFNSAEEFDCPWGCVNGFVYAKLKPGVDVDSINARMPAWERRHVPPTDVGGRDIGATFDWRLTNVRDVHLGAAQGDSPGNDVRTLVTFSVIALLILGIACVNFVNLATARASQRAREVAVRKVLGARRRQLMAQFLGESMLLVALAMLAALALVELTLPAFADFLGSGLRFEYFGANGMIAPIVALVAVVGLAGGLYPAFYLSRYQPAAVLKANRSSAEPLGTGRLRNALVVVQFAVSIGLIICTLTVHNQTVFARTSDPGYQREGLLIVEGLSEDQVQPLRETLTREIARIEGVQGVSGTMMAPGEGRQLYKMARVPGRQEPVQVGFYSVEPNFFSTMKMDVLAGRPLSRRYANDSVYIDPELDESGIDAAASAIIARGFNIVVNETAARRLGFGSPQAAVGRQVSIPPFREERGPSTATIVGVVEDARFRSLREPVEPIVYYDVGFYLWLVVRYDTAQPNLLRQRIEQVWSRLFPTLPFEAEYAEERLAAFYETDEARGQTFASFAGLAIIIACLGLFGLAAFTAERRTKEIGIRKVFGARTRDIVQLLVWQFSKPVVIANLIAWPAAWWVMRDWLNAFDARIALGPGPFVVAGLLAFAIAIGTIAGHAIRVARANPIHAL
ncbi:MAG: ABC transporter permease, partial [Pseudomonadota bacterium]|nr:ABC transporter permease [Pseudomonadota bacterium]